MAKNLTGNAVAYIRVSTGKQAKSGLGLEAQTEAQLVGLPLAGLTASRPTAERLAANAMRRSSRISWRQNWAHCLWQS
jgi:hypothetical protein